MIYVVDSPVNLLLLSNRVVVASPVYTVEADETDREKATINGF